MQLMCDEVRVVYDATNSTADSINDGAGAGEAIQQWCVPDAMRGSHAKADWPQHYYATAGHRNNQTYKGVSFLGLNDEFAGSGSDCGHLFIWSKRDGVLRRMLKADSQVLNCVEAHPYLPFTIATSGAALPARQLRPCVLVIIALMLSCWAAVAELACT
jgi:hypothetical protein